MAIRRTAFLIALGAALLALGSFAPLWAASQEFSVKVSLDRDTIGLDEQAVMTVIIAGESQNLPQPDIPSLTRFEVYSQGRSSNVSIVNGQVSSSVNYRYLLIPSKAGTYPIQGIAVVYNNQRYKGNTVELTVLDKGTATPPALEEQATDSGGSGRDYFMEAVVDKTDPFVNEQVTLTLKFYIAVQFFGSPELIEPPTTGFWNEVLGNKAPYRQRIGDRTYRVIERKYALFPTQTGELTVGQAAIRATVADRDRSRRDPFGTFNSFFDTGKEITVRSKPVSIKVRPLPKQGRPQDFTGTIGDFRITASADRREVEVNQPVTVTIAVSGSGNIKAAAEPPVPDLDDFRIYLASSTENISKLQDRLGGTKTYEQVFIPNRPGRLEIPAISYSYFDPDRKKYQVATTRPIGINVTKPEGYAGPTDLPYAGPGVVIGSGARDIRYIKNDLTGTSQVGRLVLMTPLYLVVNGLPVLLLAGAVLVRRRRDKLAANVGYARSSQAGKKARKRLAKARSLATVDQGEAFFAELHLTLTAYIADKLNISPYGLTTDRIRDELTGRSADEALITDTVGLLQRCDFARFAPASITLEEIERSLKDGEDVMIRLEGVRFA